MIYECITLMPNGHKFSKMFFCWVNSDLSGAQQVKLEPSDCIRWYHFSFRIAEIKCVEGALHDARTTLYTLPRQGEGGKSPIVIDLKDVLRTHLLTKAGPLTSIGIYHNAQ